MGGNSFDLILQELQRQKYIMEEMKAENHDLHQQLTALRRGQGIVLAINGTQLTLEAQPLSPSSTTTQPFTVSSPASTLSLAQENKKFVVEHIPSAEQNNHNKEPQMTPQAAIPSHQEKEEARQPNTFLEEIMLDEFSSALTTSTPIQQTQEYELKVSKEEQKAALRRELIGSFLLE